jgi:hypothetical protein
MYRPAPTVQLAGRGFDESISQRDNCLQLGQPRYVS